MELKVIEKKENKLSLEINGINTSQINTFRRIIISETPVLAIDEIEFLENSSALYEEMLAHRLGLISIVTDLKSYTLKERCKCEGEGCVKCQVEVTLDVKGPGTAYASDIQFSDPKIKVAYPKTPIVILLEGQNLKFSATAKLGTGKEHMKFSPGLAYHTNKAKLRITNDPKKLSEFKDKYPTKAFKDGKLDAEEIIKNNLQGVCEGICDELLKVDYEDNIVILNIESFGQLPPKEIFQKAIEVFNSKLDDFSKSLKASKESNIQKITNKIPKPKISMPKKTKKAK